MSIIAPVLTTVITALVAIVSAGTGWVLSWVKKKIKENEAANAEIDRHIAASLAASKANGEALAKVDARVNELHGLVNGRLSQLLAATAELGSLQAALAHAKGIEVGKLAAPFPGADEAIVSAKLKLVEAATEAKRILADAATAAKEAIDKDAILGQFNRRHDDPPTAQSPPLVLTPDPNPDSPET